MKFREITTFIRVIIACNKIMLETPPPLAAAVTDINHHRSGKDVSPPLLIKM